MWVPNYVDAMSEVLDLQRDPHVNDFALCEAYTFGTRALSFAFLLMSARVAQCKGSLAAFF